MKEYIFPMRIIESKGAENQYNLLIKQFGNPGEELIVYEYDEMLEKYNMI